MIFEGKLQESVYNLTPLINQDPNVIKPIFYHIVTQLIKRKFLQFNQIGKFSFSDKYRTQMNITELQKQIETLTDEINDIFHATELNFDAIKIHLQIDPNYDNNCDKNSSSTKNALISQCEKQFKNLKSAYQQRSNLRLEYLINEQIKSEQEKVRRQRLLEYEDKIYDHRRLICDKQSFYDSLLKPKTKRPPGLSNQQFQDYRIKEAQMQERSNFQQLQEETQMLLKLQKVFRNHRVMLEEQLDKYQKMKNGQIKNNTEDEDKQKEQKNEENQHQKQPKTVSQGKNQQTKNTQSLTIQQQQKLLQNLASSTPTIYQKYEGSNTAPINLQTFEQAKRLLQDYFGIEENQKQLMKEYHQEREMYRYLRWEKNDLVQKYKKLQQEIKLLRQQGKKQKKRKIST